MEDQIPGLIQPNFASTPAAAKVDEVIEYNPLQPPGLSNPRPSDGASAPQLTFDPDDPNRQPPPEMQEAAAAQAAADDAAMEEEKARDAEKKSGRAVEARDRAVTAKTTRVAARPAKKPRQ